MRKGLAFFLCVLVLLVQGVALGAGSAGPRLRVGLAVDQFSAQVSSTGKIKVVDGSGRTTVLAPGTHYVSVKQGSLYADQKKLAGSTASLLAGDPKNPVLVNRKKYRGALTVLLNSGKKNLNVVNSLPLEQYLYGVVAREVLPLWPDEAIKAQAVAARSFALYSIDNPKYANFDIRANEMGQVYGGIEGENANTTKLVDATCGMAALYDGAPIQAVFHSSGGGYTEAASAVWGKDIPYLQAVKDYDQDSPRYAWTKSLTRVQLTRLLSQGGYQLGDLQGIRLSARTAAPMAYTPDRGVSGRVKRLTFVGSKKSLTLTGSQVRSLLALDSTLFDVSIGLERPKELDVTITNGYGYPVGKKTIPINEKGGTDSASVGDLHLFTGVDGEKVTFTGNGWGHGVGLSQWGARGMALSRAAKGKRDYYKTILAHYYQGVKIKKVY